MFGALFEVSNQVGHFGKSKRQIHLYELEEELRIARQELSWYREILSRSSEVHVVWRMVPGLPLEFITDGIRQFGYSPEELLSARTSWLSLIHPEDVQQAEKKISQQILDGHASLLQYNCRIRTKAGEFRPVEIETRSIGDPAQKPVILASSLREVTLERPSHEETRESKPTAILLAELLARSEQPFAVGYMDGRIGEFNQAFCQLTGYSEEDLARSDWMHVLTPPEWWDQEMAKLRELDATGGSVRYEKEYRRKDGSRIPIEVLTHVAKNDRGQTEFYYAFITDISERKKAERALRDSEEQFRLLVEQAPLSIQILEPGGKTVMVSNSFKKLWGVTLEDLRDYNILQDRQLECLGLMPYLKKGFSGEMAELPLVEYDVKDILGKGPKRWVHATIFPVKGEQGGVRNVVLIHEDFTERKRAEEALKDSEARYRTLFALDPDALLLLDLNDLRILDVNDVGSKMYGFSREELLAMRDLAAITAGPEEARKMLELVKTQETIRSLESRHRRKNGMVFPVEINARRFELHGHDVVFSAVRDISERLHFQELLKHAKEEAESASRIKSEFIDIAAHELRTPLTPLTLLVQKAQRQLGKGESMPSSFLDRMDGQIRRLTGLVDDLLNVSRLERGGFTQHPFEVDLTGIIQEALDDSRNSASNRVITYNGPSDKVTVMADPARITQVLGNLLDNALKYSSEKEPVEVRVSTTFNQVRVSVVDHGPGIAKEQQGALFSRFYRSSVGFAHQQPGLGLGLYICRRIIELHGGTIGVESAPGKGSTFFFSLPRKG